MRKKAMKKKKQPNPKLLRAVFANDIVMAPKKPTKDEIIYMRVTREDVKRLDSFKKLLKISTRSEMARAFLIEAMNSVKINDQRFVA